MTGRKPINPKVLLGVAAVAGAVFSAIAIFMAVGYQPGGPSAPATNTPMVTTTLTTTPTMPTPIAVPVPSR